MNRAITKRISFVTAVSLLLLGVIVVSAKADSPEPMPPLPWSDDDTITPLVLKDSQTAPQTTKQRSPNSISNAFAIPRDRLLPVESRNDIAKKLTTKRAANLAGDKEPSKESKAEAQPYFALIDSDNPTVSQLERIASEARSIHAFGRLIKRCQKTLTDDLKGVGLSDQDRLTVNRITAWAYTARGQARYQFGNADAAIGDYTAALVFDPYQAGAYLNRGILLAELATRATRQKALVDFDHTLKLEPDNVIALRNRATLYLELNEPSKSLADSQQAIQVWGQREVRSRDAIVSLNELSGNAWLQLGRNEQAIAAYGRALHYDAQAATVRLRRGALLASKGEYQLAIDDLLASLKSPKATNVDSAESYRCLAWLLATCPEQKYRNASKAVESANRAFQFSTGISTSKSHKFYETLAVSYAAAGDFQQAIHYQQKVVLATTSTNEHQSAKQRLTEFEQAMLTQAPTQSDAGQLRRAAYNKRSSVK